jgi:hypothetical protein
LTSHEETDQRSRDLLARPSSAVIWWGIPFLVGVSTNVLPMAPWVATFVWAAAMAWMGLGCALNAVRCHRLHCYLAAPVLFLGAVGATAAGLGYAPMGPATASYVINVSLVLALLTFLVEPVWSKYRSR